jgi:hypothetical protein
MYFSICLGSVVLVSTDEELDLSLTSAASEDFKVAELGVLFNDGVTFLADPDSSLVSQQPIIYMGFSVAIIL